MMSRLSALKAAGCSLDFWGNDSPKCPHCGHDYIVRDNEAWHLYEEGEHEIECPSCDLGYSVSVRVSFSFSTDEQEDLDEDEGDAAEAA